MPVFGNGVWEKGKGKGGVFVLSLRCYCRGRRQRCGRVDYLGSIHLPASALKLETQLRTFFTHLLCSKSSFNAVFQGGLRMENEVSVYELPFAEKSATSILRPASASWERYKNARALFARGK